MDLLIQQADGPQARVTKIIFALDALRKERNDFACRVLEIASSK